MKNLGYGKGYEYDPDQADGISSQSHLPDALQNQIFYRPGGYGFEREIKRRLEFWRKLRAAKR